MTVTIIGGGVIGLCCAYYLRKQGHEVTVIDRNNISDGCSFGNMGYISPSHFIPLASPGIVSQGLKWMLSSTSPFYIKPRLNRDLFGWGLRFWKSANASKVAENVPHLYNLLHLSRELMNELKNELTGSFEMIEKGCWVLYKKEKTGYHEKKLAEQAETLGLKTKICTAEQVQAHETEVEVSVAGGVLYLDDCHLDSAQFMLRLYEHLQKAGVKFWLNCTVKSFESGNRIVTKVITDKGDLNLNELIIANGSWLGNTSKMLGIRLPMQPGKGYSVVYNNLEKNLQYPSILVDHRTATTPIHRWLRIGGTMELSGHSDNILPKRVLAIYKAFRQYYPSMSIPPPDPGKAWFGYRPVTPDGMPYIGRHQKFRNLSFAGGHAMLGLSAAAATGKIINQVISGRNPEIDLHAFNPERFDR